MPSDKIPCPLCKKEVARTNLGAHLLSKVHSHEIKEQNLERLCTLKEKETIATLPILKVAKSEYNICLGCKRCYTFGSIRNESASHFIDHPECEKTFRTALTTLLEEKGVVSADPDTLQKENSALKAEIERLKKQLAVPTPIVPSKVVMTSDSDLQEKYDELLSEKEELEADSDKMRSRMSKWRGLWKEFLGGAFPEKTDFDMEIEIVKEFIAKSKERSSDREADVPVPPKMNQNKVDAYLEAHVARDLETQGKIGPTLNNVELTEVSRRIAELLTKNSIVQTGNPHSQSVYQRSAPLAHPQEVPGPLGTATLLQSTKPKMMGKQVMRR